MNSKRSTRRKNHKPKNF